MRPNFPRSLFDLVEPLQDEYLQRCCMGNGSTTSRSRLAPSRSSSLHRTSSLTDIDEEFACAASHAHSAKPGRLVKESLSSESGGILGVTMSSGPRLGGDVCECSCHPASQWEDKKPSSQCQQGRIFQCQLTHVQHARFSS